MNLESITKRIKQLEMDLDKAMATVNALEGAIQDCLYWREELLKNNCKSKEDNI